MERKFILSCCSTVDLPYSYMQSRDIPVLFYTYVVDGQEYVDDMGRDPEALPHALCGTGAAGMGTVQGRTENVSHSGTSPCMGKRHGAEALRPGRPAGR